jgi:predicted alpha-1,2-mannosidase
MMRKYFVFVILISLSLTGLAQNQINYADRVNVFFGIDQTDPAVPGQIANNLPRIDTTWYNVREINGATHPGATQPLGMVSCNVSGLMEYKKGYPSGYHKDEFIGLSHFHATGTGTIRWYYNYLLFMPKVEVLDFEKSKHKILDEEGQPGWYACTLNSGIKAETTVAKKSAMHRFTFPDNQKKHLVVDVAHFLKALDTARVVPVKFPESLELEMYSSTEAGGFVLMDGFPIYFYLTLNQIPEIHSLYAQKKTFSEGRLKSRKHIKDTGVYFSFDETASNQIISKIGFSFKSLEQAKSNLYKDFPGWDFNTYKTQSKYIWNSFLSRIRVEDKNSEMVELFYSALYKSLLKPMYCEGENPYWKSDNYWADFATFWDVYTTQLPFLFTFYPEYGVKITNFYKDAVKQFGCYPPAYLMKDGLPWVYSKQASALGAFIFADAIAKELDVSNQEEMLNLMIQEMDNERGLLFQQKQPLAPSRTHNVDYSYAAFCISQVAQKLGKMDVADKYLKLSGYWKEMYDENGIIIEDRNLVETEKYPKQHFNFYEGNRWNYNYKIWHDMQGLIDMQGGDQSFIENLNWYFNLIPNNTTYQFQGLNNEVDYTTPFAYLYAGYPSRTQQILRVALVYRFKNTRGGLPGNDDSGAMSTWYAWNCMGLFPVTGQDIFLIGSPVFERVSFAIRDKKFEISTKNNSVNNIYIQSVKLNGKRYDKPYLTFSDLAKGGTLVFEMGDQPSSWGKGKRPPSYIK